MYSNSNSVVRVKRYFKKFKNVDPRTKLETEYKVFLDWGIGEVDHSGLFVLGSPYQLFSEPEGGFNADSRILVEEEELPNSDPFAGRDEADLNIGDLAFKYPMI